MDRHIILIPSDYLNFRLTLSWIGALSICQLAVLMLCIEVLKSVDIYNNVFEKTSVPASYVRTLLLMRKCGHLAPAVLCA